MQFDNPILERAKTVPSIKILEAKVEKPKVTIAIPTYKRVDKLEIAVDSAVGQTDFDDYEVLVVDNNPERDCNTEKMMLKYADNKHVTYYKNSENLGMAGNWNKLNLLAKGEYVVMLHDDDRLYPDFLRRLMVDDFDRVKDYDIIFPKYCSREWYRDNYDGFVGTMEWRPNDFLVHNLVGAPLGMTMKREFPMKVGGYSDKFYPSIDEEFYLRALSEGYKIATIYGRPYAFYNDGGNTSSEIRTFLAFYTKGGPEIFKAYYQYFNPVLRGLRRWAGGSFDRYKLEHHGRENGMIGEDSVKEAISELRATETWASKGALAVFLVLTKVCMGVSRSIRRKRQG